MEFLTVLFLGQPLWMWLAFLGIVALLLAFDLGILHRDNHEIGIRESLLLSGLYFALGLAFGGFVWAQLGREDAIAYVTGFIVEKSLAVDNLFVIAMIFAYLAVPRQYQHRVLFWGILGAILLRAVMIGLGASLVSEYAWLLYLFAAFLVATGIKMLWWSGKDADLGENPVLKLLRRRLRVTDRLHDQRFFVRLPHAPTGRLTTYVTPLFLALVLIEVTDLIFAVDSIPAIFAITTDPYIVYTSNIFAILGLRALYFALAAVQHRFAYLKQALAVLLVFIGSKIFLADLFGWTKFPAEWSLGITFAILAAGVLYSLWRTRAPGQTPAIEGDR
ncbi:membrane protein [Hypericibacter terrae]|uniref:Membrane protein n=1 Tax=Hypericibacter terrae TaxID=2602015 RepID=A0A5J6MN07_9PROT|nr:TerC family protein [Hypericibacter terrae]QEX18581.1 membrane protein [Hypericibacter terrae]